MTTTVEILTEGQSLYRFHDAAGDLLYVGISMNPPARWGQHRSDKPWWSEVASITLQQFPSRQAVEAAEREAIRTERPRYNVAHANTPRERAVHSGPLVGSSEIAALLSVSRQRVFQLTSEDDFPEPMARLRGGAVWRTEDVRAWAEKTGRKIHE